MNAYPVVLFVHVLAAAVLVGSSLSQPLLRGAILRAGSLAALRPWLRFARESARANPAAALALLASGVYLAQGRWAEPWLLVSAAVFLASSALAAGVVKATGARLAALAGAAEGPVGAEAERVRRSARWAVAMHLLLANDLAALFLMTNQPGLPGSLAAALLPAAGVLAWHRLQRRRAPAAAPACAA